MPEQGEASVTPFFSPIQQAVDDYSHILRKYKAHARRALCLYGVPGIVCRAIDTRPMKNAGCTHRTASTGAVTLMMCMDAQERPPTALRWARYYGLPPPVMFLIRVAMD